MVQDGPQQINGLKLGLQAPALIKKAAGFLLNRKLMNLVTTTLCPLFVQCSPPPVQEGKLKQMTVNDTAVSVKQRAPTVYLGNDLRHRFCWLNQPDMARGCEVTLLSLNH